MGISFWMTPWSHSLLLHPASKFCLRFDPFPSCCGQGVLPNPLKDSSFLFGGGLGHVPSALPFSFPERQG